jgi:hypothetical protein
MGWNANIGNTTMGEIENALDSFNFQAADHIFGTLEKVNWSTACCVASRHSMLEHQMASLLAFWFVHHSISRKIYAQ